MQEFQMLRVLGHTLRKKHKWTPATAVGKILFVEKRREKLHERALGIGFYSLFEYCLRAEMSLRNRQMFPGKEKCLLDHLSPFGTSCSPSFKISADI
jgi:hypothetical protein